MILVDEIRQCGAPWPGGEACHLGTSDGDLAELHRFAAYIGVPRRWFQPSDSGGFLSRRSNGVVVRPVTDSLSWFRNFEPSHSRATRTGVLVWDWTLTRADSGVGAVMPVADVQRALAARICELGWNPVPLGDGSFVPCP